MQHISQIILKGILRTMVSATQTLTCSFFLAVMQLCLHASCLYVRKSSLPSSLLILFSFVPTISTKFQRLAYLQKALFHLQTARPSCDKAWLRLIFDAFSRAWKCSCRQLPHLNLMRKLYPTTDYYYGIKIQMLVEKEILYGEYVLFTSHLSKQIDARQIMQ